MKIAKRVLESGIIQYHNENGKYHRDDGPAVELPNGYKAWYQNGLPHRLDGPAIELKNGEKYWYFNGHLNRFNSEQSLKDTLENYNDIKQFLIRRCVHLNPNEQILLRLTIKNHFPDYLDFLDKLLILQ